MFSILCLLEVNKVPAILAKEAVKNREDCKEANKHNTGYQNWVGKIYNCRAIKFASYLLTLCKTTFTYPAICHCSQSKYQPDPETEIQIECIDTVDGDESEDGSEVTEGLEGEEEEIHEELNEGNDPPVTCQTKIVFHDGANTIFQNLHIWTEF